MKHFLAEVLQVAFSADFKDSLPLNHYTEIPSELTLEAKRNEINVHKAAAVLRMIQEALSPETFSNALRYLMEGSDEFITPQNFHAALQRAHDEDNSISHRQNMTAVMESWEDLPGKNWKFNKKYARPRHFKLAEVDDWTEKKIN